MAIKALIAVYHYIYFKSSIYALPGLKVAFSFVISKDEFFLQVGRPPTT